MTDDVRRGAALASGIVSTSRYFGGMLGAIIASATLTAFAPGSRGQVLFAAIAISGLVTAVVSLGMPTGREHARLLIHDARQLPT